MNTDKNQIDESGKGLLKKIRDSFFISVLVKWGMTLFSTSRPIQFFFPIVPIAPQLLDPGVHLFLIHEMRPAASISRRMRSTNSTNPSAGFASASGTTSTRTRTRSGDTFSFSSSSRVPSARTVPSTSRFDIAMMKTLPFSPHLNPNPAMGNEKGVLPLSRRPYFVGGAELTRLTSGSLTQIPRNETRAAVAELALGIRTAALR